MVNSQADWAIVDQPRWVPLLIEEDNVAVEPGGGCDIRYDHGLEEEV